MTGKMNPGSMRGAVSRANIGDPPHPNPYLFAGEVRRVQEGMNREPSPKAVLAAVRMTSGKAVSRAVSRAVKGSLLVALFSPVYWEVREKGGDALRQVARVDPSNQPPHPNIDRFLAEVRRARARWGAA